MHKPDRSRRTAMQWAASLMLLLALTSCAELGKWTREVGLPAAMGFAKNLLGTVASNYAPQYADSVATLLGALQYSPERKRPAPATDSSLETVLFESDVAAADQEPAAFDEPEAFDEPTTFEEQQPIELAVALLQQVQTDRGIQQVAIADGATLERRESDATSDQLTVSFRPSVDCYVYVVWIDGSGWVQPLFPSNTDGFVAADQQIVLPENGPAYVVDEYVGVETVYFLASHEPRPDIAQIFSAFATVERGVTPQNAQVAEPAILERGVGDTARAQIQTRSGGPPIDTTTFVAEFPDSDLVITRWFHHK